jgi:hypothetical protein
VLTADTITDEQIRALRNDSSSDVRFDAQVALADYAAPTARRAARSRLAEILNARDKESR